MANELSPVEWTSMTKDLDFFRKIHGMFFDELNSRNLNIELPASDASPFEYWPTIEWAANKMDSITGIYGGHHYINNFDIFDNSFSDLVPAQPLVVYTTLYDDDPPAEIRNLKAGRRMDEGRDRVFLTWDPGIEKDFCHYRIYRSEKPEVEISPEKQIGTTIVNSFRDISVHNMPEYYYHVVAVDQSGNTSK